MFPIKYISIHIAVWLRRKPRKGSHLCESILLYSIFRISCSFIEIFAMWKVSRTQNICTIFAHPCESLGSVMYKIAFCAKNRMRMGRRVGSWAFKSLPPYARLVKLGAGLGGHCAVSFSTICWGLWQKLLSHKSVVGCGGVGVVVLLWSGLGLGWRVVSLWLCRIMSTGMAWMKAATGWNNGNYNDYDYDYKRMAVAVPAAFPLPECVCHSQYGEEEELESAKKAATFWTCEFTTD